MKKLVIVGFALLLSLPALSYAGSVTSRWDMTIGGYIAFDYGYASQAVGADYKAALRASGARENLSDAFTNQYAQTGETRMYFLMLGPDAWGAKTRGYLEYDFRGSGTGGSYIEGQAALRHAYMRMDWPSDQLLVGYYWNGWMGGVLPLGLIGMNLPPFGKDNRVPQIRYTHMFTKGFKGTFGMEYNGSQYKQNVDSPDNGGSGYVDNYTRANIPNFFATFEWSSDALGIINGPFGPQKLMFGWGSVYGREKNVLDAATGKLYTAATTRYTSEEENGWASIVYTFVPIVPTRNNHNAGAIGFTAGLGAGQNLTNENTSSTLAAYERPGGSFSSPVNVGWYAGMYLYLTDQLYVLPSFSTQWINVSGYYQNSQATANAFSASIFDLTGTSLAGQTVSGGTTILREDLYNLGFWYDVNPALRFGLELSSIFTRYAAPGYVNGQQAYKNNGTLNTARIRMAYYF